MSWAQIQRTRVKRRGFSLADAVSLRRFRAPEREQRLDAERFASVRHAVASSLTSIGMEQMGLARRVEDLRGWVGEMVGNDDGSWSPREPEVETALRDGERQLLAGIKRIEALAELHRFFAEIDRKLHPVPGATALPTGSIEDRR